MPVAVCQTSCSDLFFMDFMLRAGSAIGEFSKFCFVLKF